MNLKDIVQQFVEESLNSMFPIRMGIRPGATCDNNVEKILLGLLDNNLHQSDIKNELVAKSFVDYLPNLTSILELDVEAIYNGDPSAKSKEEIILAYPGFIATASYRIAHHLLQNGVLLIPRMITEYAHAQTGIDIHPGAVIGSSFCIDHGTGVVIGETAIIGDNVKIYQGVTLGALSVIDRSMMGKRHPTIEDNVVIYAHAIILGGETNIGHDSIVGGNVWITNSIPAHSKVYYKNNESSD